MDRRTFLAGTGTTVATGLTGCLGVSGDQGDYDIGMAASAFLQPDEFEPAVGEPVVWRNTGARTHTITAYGSGVPDGATYFASGGFENETAAREAWTSSGNGGIAGGETYTHTFEVAGTYHYFCIPHESAGMVGQFTVAE